MARCAPPWPRIRGVAPRLRSRYLDVRDTDSPRLHVRLAARGRYDAVVDLVPRGGERRLGRLLPHLRPGGVWVRRTGAGPDAVEAVTG